MKLLNLFVSFYHENNTAGENLRLHPDAPSSTTCSISSEAHPEPLHAKAFLHKGDNFCKETGRKIALGRALRALNLTKEQRTAIWEAYRTSAANPRWTRK